MGLDKFENEQLIRTGVHADVWFHVDSLSSAHVYVRLPLGKTWEDLAEETIEDMCQLVKNNSIQGCKLASCKIVYTPWANLKKDLVGMDTGTVGFHDAKLRRLRRCDKNREIIKRIEKSKKEVEWRYDDVKEKWVEDERAWNKGERKKVRERADVHEGASNLSYHLVATCFALHRCTTRATVLIWLTPWRSSASLSSIWARVTSSQGSTRGSKPSRP